MNKINTKEALRERIAELEKEVARLEGVIEGMKMARPPHPVHVPPWTPFGDSLKPTLIDGDPLTDNKPWEGNTYTTTTGPTSDTVYVNALPPPDGVVYVYEQGL